MSDKRKKQIETPIALVFGMWYGVEMAGCGGIMTLLPLLLGTAQCTLSPWPYVWGESSVGNISGTVVVVVVAGFVPLVTV